MPRRSRRRSTMSAAPSSATRRRPSPRPTAVPAWRSAWFATLYELLLGQERGPRFGSFVAIYGIPETRALIAQGARRRACSAASRRPPSADRRAASRSTGRASRRARSISASSKASPLRFAQPCATSHSEMFVAADDARRRIGNLVGAGRHLAFDGAAADEAAERRPRHAPARPGWSSLAAASLEVRRGDAGEADLALARP